MHGARNQFSAALLPRASLQQPQMQLGTAQDAGAMRGIDFVSMRIAGLPVSTEQLVGTPGRALEAAMLAQQPVRLMSLAGVLGCCDSGLRAALDFARQRDSGRCKLIEESPIRQRLSSAYAHLALADLVAQTAARQLSFFPANFAHTVAAAKLLVCEATSHTLEHGATVLGTRAWLTQGHFDGMFEKARRDHAMIRVIDSSEHGHRKALAMHLPLLAKAHQASALESWEARLESALPQIFDLCAPLPAPALEQLDLVARGPDMALAACQLWQTRLRTSVPDDYGLPQLLQRFYQALAQQLTQEVSDEWQAAMDWAWLHAAGVALACWHGSRQHPLFGAAPQDAAWLAALLTICLRQLGQTIEDESALEALLQHGLQQLQQGMLFCALPSKLAESPDFLSGQESA